MSFLLKIVEGPNKGAEIALVEGVAITLGKGDDCDIVLADTTLPSTPFSIEASDGGVTVDGEPLEPFAVKTSGATSFAVGPADAPWGELKWPEKVARRQMREVAMPLRLPTQAPRQTKTTSPRKGAADAAAASSCWWC